MNKLMFLVFPLMVFMLAGCVVTNTIDDGQETGGNDQIIGGDRDENGCLATAGYTFDSSVNACVRQWELGDNQKEAARIAVDYLGPENSLTVIEVFTARCPGCFAVMLEKGKDRITVNLDNWEVTGRTMTPEECEAAGGYTVNTVGGDACAEGEENLGEVTGFISPNICCKGQ